MDVDNSAANAFRECPTLYYEQYLKEGTGLELIPYEKEEFTPLELGTRGHELMEERYKGITIYPPHPNEALEAEAQVIMAGYQKRYPEEDFKVLDVERPFRVALPFICQKCYGETEEKWCHNCKELSGRQHIYTGKMDLVVENGPKLEIIDHKFEQRSAKSNLPQKWAIRDQATLYVWAASKIYNRRPDEINFVVNVVRRPSPKGQEPPTFPERQRLERTEAQVSKAVRDISIVACQIEQYKRCFKEGDWPDNREHCFTWGQCQFYVPCLYGWSEAIRAEKYQAKKPYLTLEGVPIIQ